MALIKVKYKCKCGAEWSTNDSELLDSTHSVAFSHYFTNINYALPYRNQPHLVNCEVRSVETDEIINISTL